MRQTTIYVYFLLSGIALAASNPEVPLWANGAPGSEGKTAKEVDELPNKDHGYLKVTSVHNPSLTVFLPPQDKATGAAVVIAPGGGHAFLNFDREGTYVAEYLNSIGVAGFVLKYRLAREPGSTYKIEVDALGDAQRAIRLIRSRAEEWHVNPARVGIMGFSAGGEVAALASTRFDSGKPDAADPIDRPSSRPDFDALIYPGIRANNYTIPKDMPVTFMLCADNDRGPSSALAGLYPMLKAAGIQTEVHVYATGGHGFGINPATKSPSPVATTWQLRLGDWLKDIGMLNSPPPAPPATSAAANKFPFPINYDEALAGGYTLPDPLALANGKRVNDSDTWNKKRRPEIVKLFETQQYGRSPGRPAAMTFDVFEKDAPALNGKAIRRQVTVNFSANKNGPKMDLLVYVPAAATKPVPLLLNLSFSANSTTVNDPGVKMGEVWGRDKQKIPASQGRAFGKIDVARLLDAGYGFATVYYGDIDPDFEGGLPFGVRALYLKPGQTQPAPDEWGSIAAWAWGLSRAIDYLETDKAVDAKRIGILGVSRLGKTVMWEGAHDTRVALVIASCSGEGGAALSKRNYGETVKALNVRFGYQFCANYQKYGDHVDQMPMDAHMLLALIAPRPVLLQTGDKDTWSDPKGEFLAAEAAEPVFRLLGKQGLGTDRMPGPGEAIMHTIGYYEHAGGHGTLPADWDQFLKFLNLHLQPAQP